MLQERIYERLLRNTLTISVTINTMYVVIDVLSVKEMLP